MEASSSGTYWENFLDGYFRDIEPIVEQNESKHSVSLTYTKKDIYVWFALSLDRKKIEKLEFGRMVLNEHNQQETNWIKGVFINGKKRSLTFLQTSFDSEFYDKKNDYSLTFNDSNLNKLRLFLEIPCEIGWSETEYFIDEDNCYKTEIRTIEDNWTIKMMGIGEQDMPFITDFIDIWLRVKISDAFWNDKKRTIKHFDISPMNKK